jgi:hypothetical protein
VTPIEKPDMAIDDAQRVLDLIKMAGRQARPGRR